MLYMPRAPGKPTMERFLTRLGGSFLSDVVKLSFGTLAGRAIALAALPLLTRLYGPEDFALLAVYLSLVSTIAVAACLRLEIAIPLAETETDAAGLLALSGLVLTGVVLATAVPALVAPYRIAALLGSPGIASYLWLVPLGIVFAGSYSALQYWATRARRFGDIARTRVSQTITGVGTMLALGWAGVTPFGLLLGNMLNIGAGGTLLATGAWRHDRAVLRLVSLATLGDVFRRYCRYPMFSTPEALFNIAGLQIPVLLIAAYAGAEAGFLLLAMQIMTAPMTLLGKSISQVYMSRAPEEMRAGRLAPFTLSIMKRLVIVGTGPLVLIAAVSPIVFPWVFGAEWARAGEIVTWLMPWMVLQFIASPGSIVMFVVGRQRAMLALTTAGFILRVGGVGIALMVAPEGAIRGLVIGSVCYYALVLAFVVNAAGMNSKEVSQLLGSCVDKRLLALVAIAAAIYFNI